MLIRNTMAQFLTQLPFLILCAKWSKTAGSASQNSCWFNLHMKHYTLI